MAQLKHEELLHALHECMVACNHCYDACLQEEDVKMMVDCIRLDRECADFCSFFEQAVARNTSFISELAATCATICEACGMECNQHEHKHCQACAGACFACAKICRQVA